MSSIPKLLYLKFPILRAAIILAFLVSFKTNAQPGPEVLRPETLLEETLPAAGTIFVAPAGNDQTGDGSVTSPYGTISHALSVADSGDVINCRSGNYFEAEGVRFRRSGITLQSHPGEWAVIQTPIEGENTEITVYLDTNASYSILRRLEIIGGYYYGISTETRWDWGDPDDRSGCSHILIEDCKIHDTGRDCIKIKPNCDDVVIRRCEIYNSGQQYPPGETDGNAEGIDNVNGDFMLVQDCYVHDTFTTGIYFKGGATGCIVERCHIENCGEGGVMVGFDTSPEYFDLKVNPRYYENLYGIVRNCLIENTRYAGIGLYAAKGARILNNTLIDVAKEAHAALYFGITFQDWEPEAGRPACTDVEFYNNLVDIPASSEALAVGIRYTEELGGLSALEGMPVMNYNLYFHENGTAQFEDGRPGSELETGSFSAWQQHIQNEFQSIESAPLLDANYYPLAASPAIDAGLAHELVTYDLAQNKRTNKYDVGAFERTTQTNIPDATKLPELFQLAIYPNPANNRILIQWKNPERQLLELVLYNSLGQRLQRISQNEFQPGEQQFQFLTSHLPSGTYFIGLQSSGGRQCRKLVLVK